MKKLNCVFLFGFLLILIAGCSKLDIQPDPLYSNDESALKKVKPILPVSYAISGDMAGTGSADDITLILGEAFGVYADTYTGRVEIGPFSYGREKGMRLNFIVEDESWAFTVEHYEKHAAFGIFKPGDPWRRQDESGPLPGTGDLIQGITVTVSQQ